MNDLQSTFARNLLFYRKAAGLSQEGLAERANLHRTYIGALERCERNVTIRNIEKIARALEIEPELLLRRVSSQK